MPPSTRPRSNQAATPIADPAEIGAQDTRRVRDLETRRARQIETGAPYVDLDELHSADGLFAVISQRRANAGFTFAIFKAFDRGGGMERTSFIPEEMGESYRRLIDITLDRITQIRADGSAPFKKDRP